MPPKKTHLALLFTILRSLLVYCVPLNLGEGPDVTTSKTPLLTPRAAKNESNYYGEVDISAFPSCAATNCITSKQFSPSRIGCTSAQLTTDCLCHKAPAPLACSPTGPSDEDNCWYQLEDWFSGACGGNVTMVDPATLPECAEKCVLIALSTMGCRSPTRNCLCILGRQPLVDAVNSCVAQNCAKKMQSSFSPASWRDDICKTGQAAPYDQDAYDRYIKMVHDTRIAVPVVVTLVAAGVIAAVRLTGHRRSGFLTVIGLALVAGLAIILPVELAL